MSRAHVVRWDRPDGWPVRSEGPVRVNTEAPPKGWRPPAFLGFTTTARLEDDRTDPLLWEGDQA